MTHFYFKVSLWHDTEERKGPALRAVAPVVRQYGPNSWISEIAPSRHENAVGKLQTSGDVDAEKEQQSIMFELARMFDM